MSEQTVSTPVATVRPRTSRISQAVTLVAVVVPPLGILSAMGLLWGVAFHWTDLFLLAGFYVLCAFGTTIGFHRYFTHRGFSARKPVQAALATWTNDPGSNVNYVYGGLDSTHTQGLHAADGANTVLQVNLELTNSGTFTGQLIGVDILRGTMTRGENSLVEFDRVK